MQYLRIKLSIILVLFSFCTKAQNSIAGIIKDKSSKKNIEFATVSLLNPGDSAEINTMVTDRKGKFHFVNIPAGNYLLKSSFIGYEQTISKVKVSADQQLDVGVIEIFYIPGTMKDVTVTSKRSLINTSIDRKIYNVDQDIIAQTGSASDVLKNVPSVEVDIEGNVSLRGSGDVLILINGRPSPLMGKSKAEVLQQLPANTIDRIEVITNPSARFKPDGTAGIINIVMKKNIKRGLNGSITANAGNRNRHNGNVNLAYKPGDVNIFSTLSIRKDKRIRTSLLERTDFESASLYYTELTRSTARPLSYFGTIGADYEINEKNSIGLSGSFVKRKLVRNDISQRSFYNANRSLTTAADRLRYDPESEKEKEASAYWQHNFKKEGHELHVEFNTSVDDETEDNHYTDIYYFPLQLRSFDNTLIKQTDRQQNITTDYALPLGEDAQMEAGYEGNFNQIDINFIGEIFDPVQSKFINDATRTNHFIYKDYQHALYATYQKTIDKFSYSAGVRVEQVYLEGNLLTLDSTFRNKYFNIYPTLHLACKLKKTEVQLNYSRRVNRPDGDELNPFPEYRDPRNLSAGNPTLLPELIHSVELGFKWKNKNFSFVPSLYYRYKENGFTSITYKINDSALLTTQQNLSDESSAGLELIFSAKDNKFFNANISSNLFYTTINAKDLGFTKKKSILTISTNINSTFTITKSTLFQLSSNIRSARLTPQGKVYGNFVLNTGMRQDLFNKKLSLILTASDILKTLKQRSELNAAFIKQNTLNRRDAPVIFLGASYRFGSVKKTKEENLQFDNGL
ncbi:MAG: TonB-dependent receptor [Ferruginibacter sp.]